MIICRIKSLHPTSYTINDCIPYGGKLWRVETLADLANDYKFAKVSSAKILCSILNNIINVQIRQSLFHQLCFCNEFAKVCTHQSFPLYGMLSTSSYQDYQRFSRTTILTECWCCTTVLAASDHHGTPLGC